MDCDNVRVKLNALTEERNIPVVTFNSDIVGTKRCCFVGLDNWKSGRTAAGLMGMMMRGKGKVLVITGYFSNSAGSRRVDGFVEELREVSRKWTWWGCRAVLTIRMRWRRSL
ncbi:MAG: substrate-binding domain-containing protein [Blautia marasmi]